MKTHLAVSSDRADGTHITTTLCGRKNKRADDVTNASELTYLVDCLFCKAIMNDPEHWRNRKYLWGAAK